MSKKVRNLIIAGVCVVILVAALIVLLVLSQQQNADDTTSDLTSALVEDEVDNGLIDESVDDLEYLTVQGANGSYTVRSSDELEEGASFAYTMDGYDDLPLDRYTIRTAVSTFTNATYLDIVFEDTTGVDFAMTALFVVIAVGQWKENPRHLPAIIGGVCAFVSLYFVGPDNFLLPALGGIAVLLLGLRGKLDEPPAADNDPGANDPNAKEADP